MDYVHWRCSYPVDFNPVANCRVRVFIRSWMWSKSTMRVYWISHAQSQPRWRSIPKVRHTSGWKYCRVFSYSRITLKYSLRWRRSDFSRIRPTVMQSKDNRHEEVGGASQQLKQLSKIIIRDNSFQLLEVSLFICFIHFLVVNLIICFLSAVVVFCQSLLSFEYSLRQSRSYVDSPNPGWDDSWSHGFNSNEAEGWYSSNWAAGIWTRIGQTATTKTIDAFWTETIDRAVIIILLPFSVDLLSSTLFFIFFNFIPNSTWSFFPSTWLILLLSCSTWSLATTANSKSNRHLY